jgi:hypothetical protein
VPDLPDVPNGRTDRAVSNERRRVGFLFPDQDPHTGDVKRSRSGKAVYPELSCPRDHRIGWDWVLVGEGFARCDVCGSQVLVCPVPWRSFRGAPSFYIVEVAWAEIVYMQDRHMDLPEMLRWLGLTWAPKAA